MKVVGWENPPLRSIQLTLRFIQFFNLQRPIVENCVGTDIDGSTARVDDQNLFAGLRAC
jgi:hypothetical protein